jgi:hypothetical protein
MGETHDAIVCSHVGGRFCKKWVYPLRPGFGVHTHFFIVREERRPEYGL